MSYRRNTIERTYKKYRQNKDPKVCDFCKLETSTHDHIVKAFEHFWIVENMFKYDTWDSLDVIRHLMIIPKLHTESLIHLPANALEEYTKILTEYDAAGYSLYLRAMTNKSKTIPHLHAHLLLLGGRRNNFHVFVRKPYFLWYK